jgi:hypothetical protein
LKNRVLYCFLLFFTTVCSQFVKAQKQDSAEIRPVLRFLEDSLHIGKPTPVSLTFDYPKQWQVVFCDTNFLYGNFELHEKKFFPTKTKALLSRDSAVYWLRSFEIDKIQRLRLPVFLIKPQGDSSLVYSNTDSIAFKEQISSNKLDTLVLRSDTTIATLTPKVNYHVWIFWTVTSIFLGVVVWLFFGDWIKKQIVLLNLKRKHIVFEDNLDRDIAKIRTRKRIIDIEQALNLWKKHLEQIESKPFSTYTSREILETLPITKLGESLQNIDKAIYGAIIEDSLDNDFLYLKNLANRRYIRRKKVIREG